jgi:tRNA (guanine26-N2/guanine27-N2)-dimethyltransferase
VFYNGAMALDRDLNVALLRAAFGTTGDRVGVDLFAATGVRGLRLLVETGAFRRFVAIDRRSEAVAALASNLRPYEALGARAIWGDSHRPPVRGGLDYVDVDPYGSPVEFLPMATGLVAPGGVLGVTATDLQVLSGVLKGACQRRYGSVPLRGRLAPEGGLRILLATLARTAHDLGRSIVPLAAYVHDHHFRTIVRVTGPRDRPDPIGMVDPGSFDGPPLPDGGPYGPMWLGPLFEAEVVRQMTTPSSAARPKECAKWIERFREEAEVVAPFYYEPNEIARRLHFASPPAPDKLVAQLRSAGYPAGTHVRDGAIRSPAPWNAVREIADRVFR